MGQKVQNMCFLLRNNQKPLSFFVEYQKDLLPLEQILNDMFSHGLLQKYVSHQTTKDAKDMFFSIESEDYVFTWQTLNNMFPIEKKKLCFLLGNPIESHYYD